MEKLMFRLHWTGLAWGKGGTKDLGRVYSMVIWATHNEGEFLWPRFPPSASGNSQIQSRQYNPSKFFLVMNQHFLMNWKKKTKTKTAARKQFVEVPFLVNIYVQGSSILKILLTFLQREEGNMEMPNGHTKKFSAHYLFSARQSLNKNWNSRRDCQKGW